MGVVSMLACQIKQFLFSALVVCLFSVCRSSHRNHDEAGFYTTRFGRSDPAMRKFEIRTSYLPPRAPVPLDMPFKSAEWQNSGIPLIWESVKEEEKALDKTDQDDMIPVLCMFSSSRNMLLCSRDEPWSLKSGRIDVAS